MALPVYIRRVLPWFVLGALLSLAYAISNSSPQATKGPAPPPARLKVDVKTLQAQPFQVVIPSFGTIEAESNVQLYPQVSGQVVFISPDFKAGNRVYKGQVLLRLDSAEYEVALQTAVSDLASAELALAEEEARFEQAQRDWNSQKNNTTPSSYALRQPQIKAAKARLETAKSQLKLARLNLERTELKSPFSGWIVSRNIDLGAVVGPSNKLAEGYESEAVVVRLPVSSQDLQFLDLPGSLAPGEAMPGITFRNSLASPAETWQGHLVRTEAAIDDKTQQLYVVGRIEFPFAADKAAKQPLLIGQYIEALIEGKVLDEVIVIPNAAIYQGSFVYVVDQQTIQRRDVQILWQDDAVSIIASGLDAGDRLVTTLLGQVTSGMPVDILNKEEPES